MKLLVLFCLILCSLKSFTKERLIIVNEGLWQTDNGSLSYFDNGEIVSNHWFRDLNGYKLGDTPNDIIEVNDNLIAIAINWSNIVQFITPEGEAVAATEDVPNNRKLATDGHYVYITSYGHECRVGTIYQEFTRGYVAKIDIRNFQVVAATEVGYEPEGIAYYEGYLFVANTGGYAFQEDHEYETTVTILNAETMEKVKEIDTGQINLYGKMSQSGRYLCINSPGDYYSIPAATIIFDCETALKSKNGQNCFIKLPYASTYNCTDLEGNFYAIGSRYSYYTGEYTFNYIIIHPEDVIKSNGAKGISTEMPGTILEDIKRISMPYGIYINPYTGHFYATDAGSFTAAGELLHWSPKGEMISRHKLYINPAHFLALKTNDENNSMPITFNSGKQEETLYNLQGQKINSIQIGEVYIKNGKKFIMK